MSTIGANVQWMPDGAGLAGGDRLAALDGLGVPGRGHRDRHREDGAQPVDHVEAEQQRDAEPVALDREPLQAVDLGRIGDEQQRARATLLQLRLDHLRLLVGVEVQDRLRPCGQAEVEVLGQLTGLLGRCHLSQQLIDPSLDRHPVHLLHSVIAWHRAAHPTLPAVKGARAGLTPLRWSSLGGNRQEDRRRRREAAARQATTAPLVLRRHLAGTKLPGHSLR